MVPTRRTKDDCCELIAHKVEIENLCDNLSVGVAFRVFFSCKSAGTIKIAIIQYSGRSKHAGALAKPLKKFQNHLYGQPVLTFAVLAVASV